ncbi:MAG: hypothetical protein ACE15C_20665 [Phycisphaerae bacterium]
METLTIPPLDASQQVWQCAAPCIYVDGVRRRELVVLTVEHEPAPKFGRCLMALADSVPMGQRNIEDAACLPQPGARVVVRTPMGGDEDGDAGAVEFRGVITGHAMEASDAGERIIAEASSELAVALAGTITGRRQIVDGGAVDVRDTDVHFNSGPNDLASADAVAVAGRPSRVFDAWPAGWRWTVADALAYIIATAVPAEVAAPSPEELEAIAGGIDLGELNVTGHSAADALAEIAHRGGLEVRAARDGLGIIFHRPGLDGPRRFVRLQPAGMALSPARTNLADGRVLFTRRPSGPPVLALGDHKQYEATFDLLPGWDPSLAGTRWRDFVRSRADDWPATADVFRKWVLNEHGWYSDEPWSLAVFDFGAISEEDFTLRIPRRFLPCLSSDTCGQSLGVVVEVRCGTEAPWRRWTGPVWASGGECAVYLGGDALDADFFQAAVAGNAGVRVTAAIRADARLTARIAGNAALATKVLDLSRRAAWRKVHPSSIFPQASGLGAPAERDDSIMLGALARAAATAASRAVDGEMTLGWIDPTLHPGDIVERIDGRWVELASNLQRGPAVSRVRHDYQAQKTTITVSG